MLANLATLSLLRDGCRRRLTGEIETRRLVLRRPQLRDVPAIAKLANDRRIAEMTRLPYPYLQDHAEAFVTGLPEGERGLEPAWLIEHLGEPVGMIGLTVETRSAYDLGYWLATRHTGQGFATEAVQGVLGAVFCRTDADQLTARARVANEASRGVLERCGFVWTDCVLERSDLLGYSVPVDRFRLTKKAWTAR